MTGSSYLMLRVKRCKPTKFLKNFLGAPIRMPPATRSAFCGGDSGSSGSFPRTSGEGPAQPRKLAYDQPQPPQIIKDVQMIPKEITSKLKRLQPTPEYG